MNATIIIPFHRDLSQLGQSLPAARRSLPDAEIIVAADGAVDDCRPLATACGACVIDVPGPSGPAVARNRASRIASGGILLFVDADVIAAPDALAGMFRMLEQTSSIAAVFGAYDLSPPQPNFMSQYKNLSHAYVHETGNQEAATFWAGLGAIRADAFRAVGGFDERFTRPSVEDIDLGYRMRRAGYRIRLDPQFRGRHLKRWTLWSSIVIDIRARGVPWAQLIHRYQALANDLNTRFELRLSVLLSYLFVAFAGAAVFLPMAPLGALASLAALVALNFRYYRWFARQRGAGFALRVIPAHILHHLGNGISFVAGTALHLFGRWGFRLPGALPTAEWNTTPVASIEGPR
ncbi:MAG: glycosyltransferase family 2 protein [Vicinamibacterales bacterium]